MIQDMMQLVIAGKHLQDITNQDVLDQLERADIFTNILRTIGQFIYMLIQPIIDGLDTVFNEVMRYNAMTIIDTDYITMTLSDLAWSILGILLILTIFLKLFEMKGDFSFLKNLLVVAFSISIFSSFCDFAYQIKDAGIEMVDNVINKDDISMSQTIYNNNSYDMLASINQDNLVRMSEHIDPWRFDYNETLDKDQLQGKISYDDNGNLTYKDLRDGVAGVGDERYYKYDIDYVSINLILFALVIFYLLGIYKEAYIVIDLFFIQISGIVTMSTSLTSTKKVKMIFGCVLKAMITAIITYATIALFTVFVKGIINSDLMFISKIIFIVVYGVIGIAGGGFFSKILGLDDGTGTLMKGMFVGRSLNRMAGGAVDTLNKTGDSVGGIMNNGYQAGKSYLQDEQLKYQGTMNDLNDMRHRDVTRSQIIDDYNTAESASVQLDNQDYSDAPIYAYDGYDPDSGSGFTAGHYHKQDVTDSYNDEQASYNDVNGAFTSTDIYGAPDGMCTKSYDEYKRDYEQGDTSVYKPIPSHQTGLSANTVTKIHGDYLQAPDGMCTKSYDEYKRDYEQGDTSVYKPAPSYYKDTINNKQLPSWFYDTDTSSDSIEEFNEQEFEKELERLKKQSAGINVNQHNDELDYVLEAERSSMAYDDFLNSLNGGKKGDKS